MQKSTGIHCKVICNDQIRRFQFSGTEFSSLQDQIKKILGLNSEFVLKYKDNEGDMITISSTEELACAIDISQKTDGGLIRLTVFSAEKQPPTVTPNQPQEYGSRDWGTCPRRGGRGRWGGGGGRGRWCRSEGQGEHPPGEFPPRNRSEKRRAKLTFKRDLFKTYLSTLEGKELTPEEERSKQMYLSKVQRLDFLLNEWFGQQPTSPPPPNPHPPPSPLKMLKKMIFPPL